MCIHEPYIPRNVAHVLVGLTAPTPSKALQQSNIMCQDFIRQIQACLRAGHWFCGHRRNPSQGRMRSLDELAVVNSVARSSVIDQV